MAHSAGSSPAERIAEIGVASWALWDLDPALLPALRTIVISAAAAATGACLAVAGPDGPRILVSVRGTRASRQALALTASVLERGELMVTPEAVGAPVRGPHELVGALLLGYRPSTIPLNAEYLAGVHAARIEMALAASAGALAATHSAAEALWQMLCAHDQATALHARQVGRLACLLGVSATLKPVALLELELVGLLHDVGKIGLAPHFLRKPGPLDGAEWALVRQHPAIGERIVRTVPALDAAGVAVRHHHERWDGGGYPDRLAGPAIPLAARLVALADAYETMRTGRPYQPARTRDEALAELRRGAGTQFDPSLVRLLPALAAFDLDL